MLSIHHERRLKVCMARAAFREKTYSPSKVATENKELLVKEDPYGTQNVKRKQALLLLKNPSRMVFWVSYKRGYKFSNIFITAGMHLG